MFKVVSPARKPALKTSSNCAGQTVLTAATTDESAVFNSAGGSTSAGCRYEVSLTVGAVFHETQMRPCRCGFRPSSWSPMTSEIPPPAWRILHRMRKAMGDRNTGYALAGVIELDAAYFGTPNKDDKRG